MEKYMIGDLVFDSKLNKHIILTAEHPVFNSNTSWSDMTLYYNVLKFRPIENADIINVYNSVPKNRVNCKFISFTKNMKYKVELLDGTIKYFTYLF